MLGILLSKNFNGRLLLMQDGNHGLLFHRRDDVPLDPFRDWTGK